MIREYPVINVPDHIDNQGAYIRAAHRRIDAMRAKSASAKRVKWIAEDETRAELIAEIEKIARTERQNADGSPTFMAKMFGAIMEWGSLSIGQEAACRKSIAASAERKAKWAAENAEAKMVDQEISKPVGIVGARSIFSLTLRRVVSFDGHFGPGYVNEMADVDGNVFVYIGGAKLGEKGDALKIKATVKAHAAREGVMQTALSRPAAVKGA